MMNPNFHYKNGELFAEEVAVEEIASLVGTPCYIYSHAALAAAYKEFSEAFSKIDPIICYSIKSNSNIAVLKIFANAGSGFDIVSGGELLRIKEAGGDPSKVVFSGVGKSEDEMRDAIESGILFFNVESEDELVTLNSVALEMGTKAPAALRVNPDIDPKTHPYISTGLKKSKFGIEITQAIELYRKAGRMEGIDVVAVDAHIGSQIFDLDPFTASLRKLIDLSNSLRDEGIDIKYIDMGGGLGIRYSFDEDPPSTSAYADALYNEVKDTPYKIVLEPGRAMSGNCGILATRVLYNKASEEKKFVIVDAGFNDLLRPAFYGAEHVIMPAKKSGQPPEIAEETKEEIVEVVGPVCETVDVLGKEVSLPELLRGDLLVMLSAGAYGFVMSSNYNSRRRPAEVLVHDGSFDVIRQRETEQDLIRGESIPSYLK